MRLTHLSLFTGIGGLDLAAETAGFQTVGQCEWADYPTKVLEKHWPDVPRWRDIRTLTGESFYKRTGLRTVDVISGGFPCQPFSVAGKRRGKDDDRYLWPELLRIVQEIRPTWFVGENVAGIVSMALDQALSDLEDIGYTCQAFIIPACAVDAPHRRDRCAIVANTDSQRRNKFRIAEISEKPGQFGGTDYAEHVSDARDRGGPLRRDRELSATQGSGSVRSDHRGGTPEHGGGERRTAKPGVGRSFDGLSAWLDRVRAGWADGTWEAGIPRIEVGVPGRVQRIKCLGNAVVPAQFYPVFRAIYEAEARK